MNDIVYYIDTAIDTIDWRNNEDKIWYTTDKNFVFTTVKVTAVLTQGGSVDKDKTTDKARKKALDNILDRFQRDPNAQVFLTIPNDESTGNPAIYVEPIKIAGFRIYRFLFAIDANEILGLEGASAIDADSPQIINPLGPAIRVARCSSTSRGWIVAKSASEIIGYAPVDEGINEELTIGISKKFTDTLGVILSIYKDPGDVAHPKSFFKNDSLLVKSPQKVEGVSNQQVLLPVTKVITLHTAEFASKAEAQQEERDHVAGFVAGVSENMDKFNSILSGKNTALEQLGLPKETTELLSAVWATPELEALGFAQDWTVFGQQEPAFETSKDALAKKEQITTYATDKGIPLKDAYKAFNYASRNKDLLSKLGLGGQGGRCLDDLLEATNFITDPAGILDTLYDRMVNKLDWKVIVMVVAKLTLEAIPDSLLERNDVIKCIFGTEDFKKYLVCQIADSVNQIEATVNLIKQFVVYLKNLRFENILDPLKIERLLKKLIMFAIISAVYLLINFLLKQLGLDTCDLSLDKIDEFFALDCGSAGQKIGNIGAMSTLALLSDDARFRKNVAEVEGGIFALSTLSKDAIQNFDDFVTSNIENFGFDISVDEYRKLVQAVDITFSRENLHRLFKGDTSRSIRQTLDFIIEEFKIPLSSREAELLFKAAGTVLADEDFELREDEHPEDCDPVDKFDQATAFYSDLPAEAQEQIELETQKVVDTITDICDKFDTPITVFDIIRLLFNANEIPLVQETASAALNFLFDSIDTQFITTLRSKEESNFSELLGDMSQAALWRAYQPDFDVKAEEDYEVFLSLGFNRAEITEMRILSPIYKLCDTSIYEKCLSYGLPLEAASSDNPSSAMSYAGYGLLGMIGQGRLTSAVTLTGGSGASALSGLSKTIERGDADQMKKDFIRSSAELRRTYYNPWVSWGSLGANLLFPVIGGYLAYGWLSRFQRGGNFYLEYNAPEGIDYLDFGKEANEWELDGKLPRAYQPAYSWDSKGQNPRRKSGAGFIFEKNNQGEITSYKYQHAKKYQDVGDAEIFDPTYSFELLRDEPKLKVVLTKDILGILNRPPIWKDGRLTDEEYKYSRFVDLASKLGSEIEQDKYFGDWKPLREYPDTIKTTSETNIFLPGKVEYELEIIRDNVDPVFGEPAEGKIETTEKFAGVLPEELQCRSPFKTFRQWYTDKMIAQFGTAELNDTNGEGNTPLVRTDAEDPGGSKEGFFDKLYGRNIYYDDEEVPFEEWVCGSLLMFITPYKENYIDVEAQSAIDLTNEFNNYVQVQFDPFAATLPGGTEKAGIHSAALALKGSDDGSLFKEDNNGEEVPNNIRVFMWMRNPIMRAQRYNYSIGIKPDKYVQTEMCLLEESYKFEPFYMQESYYMNPHYTKINSLRKKIFEEDVWKDLLDISSIKSSVFDKLRNELLKLKKE